MHHDYKESKLVVLVTKGHFLGLFVCVVSSLKLIKRMFIF